MTHAQSKWFFAMATIFLKLAENLPKVTHVGRHGQLWSNQSLASMAALIKRIGLYIFTGRVKTLPMFHLSNEWTIAKPAVFFAVEPKFQGVLPPGNSLTHSFYSGLYIITGYKHTVSPRGIYSEFSLAKNPGNDLDSGPPQGRVDVEVGAPGELDRDKKIKELFEAMPRSNR